MTRPTALRHLLIATALTLAALPAAAPAQHADLEPEAAADAAPMVRRFMMEDAWGQARTGDDYLGQFVLIYFGYTGCPDVCPTSLSTIADAMDKLGDKADQVVPLFVTVDPDRDSAKLLQEYAAAFDDRIIPLRGPKEYTDHMVKAFNARYEKHIADPAHPEAYSIDHTASIALLGPDGMLMKRYPHGTSAEDMAADLGALIDAAPKP